MRSARFRGAVVIGLFLGSLWEFFAAGWKSSGSDLTLVPRPITTAVKTAKREIRFSMRAFPTVQRRGRTLTFIFADLLRVSFTGLALSVVRPVA